MRENRHHPTRPQFWILCLVVELALLVGCGPRHVNTLPKSCSPGEEVVHHHGKECESRCTCTVSGGWNCRDQPCQYRQVETDDQVVPGRCVPGAVTLEQRDGVDVRCTCRHDGQLYCDETQPGPPDPGDQDSNADQTDPAVGGETAGLVAGDSDQPPPPAAMPAPCRDLECPAPSRRRSERRDDGIVMSECVDPDDTPIAVRRFCYQDGRWDESKLRNGVPYGMRSHFDGTGKLQLKTFAYRGRQSMSCVPQPDASYLCGVRVADILDAQCWAGARIPKNSIRVVSSAKQLGKYFACDIGQAGIDWTNTQLVLLRQQLSPSESSNWEVRQTGTTIDVVAKIEPKCSGIRAYPDSPATQEWQSLLPMPRDQTTLRVRIERSTEPCGPRP